MAEAVIALEQSKCQGKMADILKSKANSLRRVVFPLSKYMAWAGVATLTLLGCITFYDVFMRNFFNRPTPSITEIAELLLCLTVFFGFAYTGMRKSHVNVDIVLVKLPGKAVTVISSISMLTGIYLFIVMGWQQIEKAIISYKTFEISAVAHIPYYPQLILMAFACALMALVLVVFYLELKFHRF
ncbi:TRAP transporter, DctQ-like membrane protein [delta proteobacterium NaphS2]|nr:TRAP transporter, DctQ-like membrane protein [delta proteobacterium NaphS2]